MSEGQAQKSGAPDPLIGRVIADRFKITSLIARGGMGKVYRAEQAPLGRLCAVKVLNPNYNGDADPEFHRRFFREASITSKITHPNSVTIFDYGKTDDDIYYMAMEYLEGQTLHMALREVGVMPEMRVGRIASQICRALREAHKLGVIHRDLKPANIFLTRPSSNSPEVEEDQDFVKVLDFGLVKHLSERPEEQLTQTGLFMGSPKYMAPEQIQGGHVDERTDIYSLGIIMYEMLAGKVPFERATSVNILMAHVGEPPPPMREVNPNLICSPAFEEIVMSCIAKDPNLRLSSMDHLLAAIRRAHGGSLTGQLAAVTASAAYAAQPLGSAPPPHVAYRHPSVPPPPVMTGTGSYPVPRPMGVPSNALASGSHTPMGIIRAEASNDIATDMFDTRPRSKLWILVGIVLAAVVGGGLGLLAFQMTAPPPPHVRPATPSSTASVAAAQPEATPSSAPSAVPSSEPVATPSATESAAPPKGLSVKITTDPPSVSVRENNTEVCASTPCELALKDGDTKVHKLTFQRPGYRPESRSVKGSDGAVHVKLAHLGGAVAPKITPKPDGTTTPNGFKDAY